MFLDEAIVHLLIYDYIGQVVTNSDQFSSLGLFTQHHALLLVQVAEVRIVQVFDKVDGLAG